MKAPAHTQPDPAFLRPPEAAAYCSISRQHLAALTRRGVLRAARIGRRCTLYAKADLEKAILSMRTPAATGGP